MKTITSELGDKDEASTVDISKVDTRFCGESTFDMSTVLASSLSSSWDVIVFTKTSTYYIQL